MLNYNEKRLS